MGRPVVCHPAWPDDTDAMNPGQNAACPAVEGNPLQTCSQIAQAAPGLLVQEVASSAGQQITGRSNGIHSPLSATSISILTLLQRNTPQERMVLTIASRLPRKFSRGGSPPSKSKPLNPVLPSVPSRNSESPRPPEPVITIQPTPTANAGHRTFKRGARGRLKENLVPTAVPAPRGKEERSFRQLRWDEVVRYGDYVEIEGQGFQEWNGPGGFRAASFVSEVYRVVRDSAAGDFTSTLLDGRTLIRAKHPSAVSNQAGAVTVT